MSQQKSNNESRWNKSLLSHGYICQTSHQCECKTLQTHFRKPTHFLTVKVICVQYNMIVKIPKLKFLYNSKADIRSKTEVERRIGRFFSSTCEDVKCCQCSKVHCWQTLSQFFHLDDWFCLKRLLHSLLVAAEPIFHSPVPKV